MRIRNRALLAALITVFGTALAFGEAEPTAKERFSVDRLMEGLDKELQSLEQELSKLKPVVEQKSREFQQLIDTKAKQGFMELQSLSRELDDVVGGFQKELDNVLSDEQMQKAIGFLENLDGEAIAGIRDEILGRLEDRLKVAEGEWDKIRPVLEGELKKQGELLKNALQEGVAGLERFKGENGKLWEETSGKLDDVLNSDQMKSLEAWQGEVGRNIERLFKGLGAADAEKAARRKE